MRLQGFNRLLCNSATSPFGRQRTNRMTRRLWCIQTMKCLRSRLQRGRGNAKRRGKRQKWSENCRRIIAPSVIADGEGEARELEKEPGSAEEERRTQVFEWRSRSDREVLEGEELVQSCGELKWRSSASNCLSHSGVQAADVGWRVGECFCKRRRSQIGLCYCLEDPLFHVCWITAECLCCAPSRRSLPIGASSRCNTSPLTFFLCQQSARFRTAQSAARLFCQLFTFK